MPARRRQLANARRAAGFSQESLAEQLGVDRCTVQRWEAGETSPQPNQRLNLATALGVSRDELTIILSAEVVLDEQQQPTGSLPSFGLQGDAGATHAAAISTLPSFPVGDATDRRQAIKLIGTSAFGAGALSTGIDPFMQSAAEAMEFTRRAEASQLGPKTLEHLEMVVSGMAAAFAHTPPHELFPKARWYRRQVEDLIAGQHTLREGRELYRHAGWLSIVLAWTAHDLGDSIAAEAYCLDAWEHGWQTEDNEICAWAMDARATIAMYGGQPTAAREAAERGLKQAPAGSAATVRVSAQLARAYAKLGDADKFQEVLSDAHSRLDQLDQQGAGLFSADAGRLASYVATAHIWLRNPHEAIPHAREAIAFYGEVSPAQRSPTREAISRLDLAMAEIELGKPDDAAEQIRRALSSERITGSVLSRLRDVSSVLRQHYPQLEITKDAAQECRELTEGLNRAKLT